MRSRRVLHQGLTSQFAIGKKRSGAKSGRVECHGTVTSCTASPILTCMAYACMEDSRHCEVHRWILAHSLTSTTGARV